MFELIKFLGNSKLGQQANLFSNWRSIKPTYWIIVILFLRLRFLSPLLRLWKILIIQFHQIMKHFYDTFEQISNHSSSYCWLKQWYDNRQFLHKVNSIKLEIYKVVSTLIRNKNKSIESMKPRKDNNKFFSF